MSIVGQMFINYVVHDQIGSVIEPHSFGNADINTVEMVVTMDCDIGEPANSLCTVPAIHYVHFVSDMHLFLVVYSYVDFEHRLDFYLF